MVAPEKKPEAPIPLETSTVTEPEQAECPEPQDIGEGASTEDAAIAQGETEGSAVEGDMSGVWYILLIGIGFVVTAVFVVVMLGHPKDDGESLEEEGAKQEG